MNKPDNHNCVRVDMKPTDFVAGDGNIKLGAVPPVPSGNWLPYYEFFERQMLTYGDTECCVLFTTQEAFDAQIEQQIQSGVISPQTVAWFDSLGYMDIGADNKKHFHTSPRWLACLTGNGLNGNNVVDGWDVLRNNGPLPYTDFPVDPSLTPQQFVDPSYITQAMRNKAQQFQLGVGGKNFVQYHWLSNGSENLQTCETALGYSPLCDGVNVGSDWNETNPPAPTTGANPGHCVGRFANLPSNTKGEYDHYLPNPKYLINYPVWYSLQAVVTITPPPPAPLPPTPPQPIPTVQPTQQNVIILQAIVALYQEILALLNPKVGSSNTQMTNYNILKSKTFWTSVLLFVFNGFTAISGSVPSEYSVPINFILGALIAYFHVSGVNAAAVSSAAVSQPVSGQ